MTAGAFPSLLPLQAHIVLNLTADLRSEFSWNTKQIFVYVNFDFKTRKNARNQMVMWSAILEDKVGPLWGRMGRDVEGLRRLRVLRAALCSDSRLRYRRAQPPAPLPTFRRLPARWPRAAPGSRTPAHCPRPPQERAFIHLPALRAQYPYALTDQGFNLRGREFDVTVAWNVMPRVGALYTRSRTFAGALRWPRERRSSCWAAPLALTAVRVTVHVENAVLSHSPTVSSKRLSLLRPLRRHWQAAGYLSAAHPWPRAAARQHRDGRCARSCARRHGASLLHRIAVPT